MKIKSLRILFMMVLAVSFVFALSISVSAADFDSGSFGDGLHWEKVYNVLTVSGNGEMPDYEDEDDTPWHDEYEDDISKIVVEDGVLSIGKNAFRDLDELKTVDIAGSVKTINKNAFYDCDYLETIILRDDGVETICFEAFSECEKIKNVVFPSALREICEDAFEDLNSKIFESVWYTGDYWPNVSVVEEGNEVLLASIDKNWIKAAEKIIDYNKWYSDDNYHWHQSYADFYYTVIRTKEEHYDYDYNGICDACGKKYIDYEIDWTYDDTHYEGVLPNGKKTSGTFKYQHDGKVCWAVLPDDTKVNEKTINYNYDSTSYSATLPDGTVISGNFEWKYDGMTHWHELPNGQRVSSALHSANGNSCAVCGCTNMSASYIDKNGNTVPFSLSDAILITNPTLYLSGGKYVVSGNVSLSTRLDVSADSTIILTDGCELNINGGIHVSGGKTLTICSQSLDAKKMGRLIANATSWDRSAGIGANDQEGNSHIVICGGRIEATGGEYGAGIGSGHAYNPNHNSFVEIYNGDIKAWGGDWSAGIGGGYMSSFKVNIYNGKVEAWGGSNGSGIGAGHQSFGGSVYISESANAIGHGGDKWCSDIDSLQDTPVTGFTLSQGNTWIIIAGAVVILGGIVAIVVNNKKKKAVPADGEVTVTENTEKTEE